MTIKPDSIDYQRVEQKHGPLPASASDAEHVHRYRLAQVAAYIRLFGAKPDKIAPRGWQHDGERNT